jgi:hypothetical protein
VLRLDRCHTLQSHRPIREDTPRVASRPQTHLGEATRLGIVVMLDRQIDSFHPELLPISAFLCGTTLQKDQQRQQLPLLLLLKVNPTSRTVATTATEPMMTMGAKPLRLATMLQQTARNSLLC